MGNTEKKVPASAVYTQKIYNQTVLGTEYVDCSNQNTINNIFLTQKIHLVILFIYTETIIMFILCVKVVDEYYTEMMIPY